MTRDRRIYGREQGLGEVGEHNGHGQTKELPVTDARRGRVHVEEVRQPFMAAPSSSARGGEFKMAPIIRWTLRWMRTVQ